jgi:hypothetical protein
MKVKEINWVGVGVRFLLALILVFATYNPSGYSYFDWGIKNIADFSILKLFVGVVLLIGWTMFIRATLVSLGPFGVTLAAAFFGTLLWLVVDLGLIPAGSVTAVTYLILVAASAVLATGMTWSHVRRRVSGQLDVDETDVD